MTAPPPASMNAFTATDLINLLALLLSPLIAVGVTLWWQKRQENRKAKRDVLVSLISTRHTPLVDDALRAYHMIDVVFHDSPKVRVLWHEYYEMINNEGLNNENGWRRRQDKSLEMVTEMAKTLGYDISHLDVKRVYYPHGLGTVETRNNEIMDELLRVLKGSAALAMSPRDRAVERPDGGG